MFLRTPTWLWGSVARTPGAVGGGEAPRPDPAGFPLNLLCQSEAAFLSTERGARSSPSCPGRCAKAGFQGLPLLRLQWQLCRTREAAFRKNTAHRPAKGSPCQSRAEMGAWQWEAGRNLPLGFTGHEGVVGDPVDLTGSYLKPFR